MRIMSSFCCSLVLLSLHQSICRLCFQLCRVALSLWFSLFTFSFLCRHGSQPLLVVTAETIDLYQVVVSGLVLESEKRTEDERGEIKCNNG